MIGIVLVDSPAIGLFKFLVARGGINQYPGYESFNSVWLFIAKHIVLSFFLTLYESFATYSRTALI
jgi:hypothetical protein